MGPSIAFIKSHVSAAGGLEKYTKRLVAAYVQRGYRVFLLTTDNNHPLPGCTIVSLGTRSKCSLWHLLRFDYACKQWLAHHPVDIVFGLDRNFCKQTHYRAGNGVHAAYLERRKAFSSPFKRLSFLLNPLHWLILAMEKKTFESADLQLLFTNSEMVRQEVLRHYPKVQPDKVKTVHNGVEWQEMALSFKKSFDIERSDDYRFLFVGNEYDRKGLPLLLEALSLLKERKFSLAVVGKERNTKKFSELARTFGLQDQVQFFGPQTEGKVIPFYQAADCCVIPSRYDPFANTTVEALAMGLYVVSSSNNGGSEVIASDNMGLVFTDYTARALAACLETAMNHPKTQESAHTIRQAIQHLDFSHQITQLIF